MSVRSIPRQKLCRATWQRVPPGQLLITGELAKLRIDGGSRVWRVQTDGKGKFYVMTDIKNPDHPDRGAVYEFQLSEVVQQLINELVKQ